MENWQQFLLMVHLLALLTGLMYIHHDAVIRGRSGFWSVIPVVVLSWIWVILWFLIRPPRGGHRVNHPIAARHPRAPQGATSTSRPQPVNHGRMLFAALNELQWQQRLGNISQEHFNQEKAKLLTALAEKGVEQPFSDLMRELTVLTDSDCLNSQDIKQIEQICQAGEAAPPVNQPDLPPPQPFQASLTPEPLQPAPIQPAITQNIQEPKPAQPKAPYPPPTQSRPAQSAPPPEPVRQTSQPQPQPQQAPFQSAGGANSPDFYKNWSTQLLVREFLRTKDSVMGKALGLRGLPGELEPLMRQLGATRLIDLYNETKSPELAEELRRRRLDRFL